MPRPPYRIAALLAICVALAAAPFAGHSPAQTDAAGSAANEAGGAAPQEIGPSGLPLPRFVSLRAPKVNLRRGPGIRYPIEWVYERKGLPLEVIDEFETWRRVRDWQGSVGWVHQSMLSGQRNALVRDEERTLRRAPRPEAVGIARVQPGVVGRLRECLESWCRVEVGGFEGWLRQDEIYGAYPDETVE